MSEVTDLFCLDLPESFMMKIRKPDGTLVIEEDAVILDMIFQDCRNERKLETTDERIQWMKEIMDALNHRYGCNLAFSQTVMVVNQVGKVIASLKKSAEDSPPSPTSSPDQPDPSLPESST